MKYGDLKKQLFKEGGIRAGVLVVLGGLTFGLSSYSDNYAAKNNELKSQADAIVAQANALQDKYTKVQKDMGLYQEIAEKDSHGGLSLNRQVVKDEFNQLNDQYALGGLHLSMQGIDEMKDAQYKRSTEVVIAGDVSASFETVADDFAYGLMNRMQRELPGTAKITKLTLTRAAALSDEVLRAITQRGTYPLMHGEVKFTWLGLKPVEAGDTNVVKQKN